MAGARAATSLSLTIAVAAATLVVMGGILAGPAILDCARDGSKFGACLRDKIAQSGLIAPEGETVEKQILTSEVSSSEPADEPPIVAETPRPAGWLEANANEYEPRPPASAVLSGGLGELLATGEAPGNAAPSVDVALAQPLGVLSASGSEATPADTSLAAITHRSGELLATGEAPNPPSAAVDVALAAPAGRLSATGQGGTQLDPAIAAIVERSGNLLASGNATAEPGVPTDVSLAAPTGRLNANGQGSVEPDPARASLFGRTRDLMARGDVAGQVNSASIDVALAGPVGDLTASLAVLEPSAAPASLTLLPRSGSLTVLGGGDTSVMIEANVSPERYRLGIPLATGSIGGTAEAPASVLLEASVASPVEQPIPEPPKPVIEFNPAFPNVLVLPPPSTGEDSSFRTLQLN